MTNKNKKPLCAKVIKQLLELKSPSDKIQRSLHKHHLQVTTALLPDYMVYQKSIKPTSPLDWQYQHVACALQS